MKTRILLGTLCLGLAAAAREPEDEAPRVVIVANADQPDSLELARHYAERRGIPPANIVALPLSAEETIDWDAYVRELHNPLQRRLIEEGWIDAAPGVLEDAAGRTRIAARGHRIAYLVVCRGVPLRIRHDPARSSAAALARLPATFRTNQASVDAELAFLATQGPEVTGPAPNPFFEAGGVIREGARDIVRVARLDGPSAEACRRMVDTAVLAETRGLAGRAYVDTGGPHASGDAWLRAAGGVLEGLGFDLDGHAGAGVMAVTDRFDAPAFYFGWYAGDLTGPFRLPGLSVPAGAIAVHIHSFSASTLRSETSGWCGPLVGLGFTATLGNVFEPYLELSHRPDLFMRALADGATLGAAAHHALPALSWQAVLIGDPLYRPFKHAASTEDPAGYAALREFNLRRRDGDPEEALAWLESVVQARPEPATALRLARERSARGEASEVRRALAPLVAAARWDAQEFALALAAAGLLVEHGGAAEAVAVHRALMDSPGFDDTWRRLALPAARAAAIEAGEPGLAEAWSAEAARLTPTGP